VSAAGGAISIVLGTVLLRLTLAGTYKRYVREEMGVWLLLAAIVVIALGIVTIVRALRGDEPADGHDHADHEGHVPVGWLLLAPIAALLLVAPPTLGSYGVDRAGRVDVSAGARVFDRLPRTDRPAPMTLLEFAQRAFDHDGASFNGVTVQLTGFVAGDEGGAFRLARYQIACCAADATPVVVLVSGAVGDPPSRDRWVTVTGAFRRNDGELPELGATSIAEIPAPNDPYE
jgi:uncharacterized repeat protein (TIGR03943 family)